MQSSTGALSVIQSVVTHRGIIYPWQCDHMGHMNVMWYTAKFDEASWQMLSRVGLSRARMQREAIGMAAVEQHLQYKRELRAGDAITVRSSILEVNDKSVRVSHELRNDETGEVAAVAVIVAVHIDAIARKAQPLPEDVRARALRTESLVDALYYEDSFESLEMAMRNA